MPYMIPYYQSGILVTFRCTDCDWTYTIGNPSTSPVPRDEEEKAKEQYVAHSVLRVLEQDDEEIARTGTLAQSDYSSLLECLSVDFSEECSHGIGFDDAIKSGQSASSVRQIRWFRPVQKSGAK